MDYDGTGLYPLTIGDDNSVCPKIESGSPITLDMNDELIEFLLVVILIKAVPYSK